VLKKTHHESELIDLKNRYLKQLELQHYNHLKQVYNAERQRLILAEAKQIQFQRQVYEQAKKIVKQKMAEREANAKQWGRENYNTH